MIETQNTLFKIYINAINNEILYHIVILSCYALNLFHSKYVYAARVQNPFKRKVTADKKL